MKVSEFDFHLPPERIATQPAEPRDAARLLHVCDTLSDRIVRDLPSLLSPGDVMVFNDSRVIPARLFAEVNGKQVEVLLHQSQGEHWSAFARPAKKLKEGMILQFAPAFQAIVAGRTADGQVLLKFPYTASELFQKLHAHGHVPLPPYIARADEAADKTNYQTMYAKHDGSVAAPTAGLHFTPELMAALKARGVETAFVTLHVGAGTFQPVKVEDTDAHVMHREWGEISAETAALVNRCRAAGGKVVAVGTTSLRLLESAAVEVPSPLGGGLGWGRNEAPLSQNNVPLPTSPLQGEGFYELAAFIGDTGIFITPGYRFKIVDHLMTNFHLPKSTLFMLVSAFAGLERMHAAYAHAIANDYRFYSYGDTSLLEKA